MILLLFVIISIFLTLLLFVVSLVGVFQNRDEEKISSYECGFQPFEDTRQKFDIKYYIIAILFIIFDLEIVFIFPWMQVINIVGLMVMVVFLFILTLGFCYEWLHGVLRWN